MAGKVPWFDPILVGQSAMIRGVKCRGKVQKSTGRRPGNEGG
jgi:hypothetical protein